MILILILFSKNTFYQTQKNKYKKNIGNTNKYFPLLKSDLNIKYIISKNFKVIIIIIILILI